MVKNIVSGGTTKTEFDGYVAIDEKPEVVVLYLDDKLRTDHLATYQTSFSPLKELLSKSASSMVVPFVDVGSSYQDSIISIARSVSGGSIYYIDAGKGGFLKELQEKVKNVKNININEMNNIPNSIYSDSKADLIIVHLGSNENAKERYDHSVSTIVDLNQKISSQTSKFLAIYTGLSYDEPPKSLHIYSKRNIFDYSSILVEANNGTINGSNGSGWFFTYFGGWFWEVLLFVVITTPVLVSGIYAINSIQTPDRFIKPKQK